jgi:protein-tyrosine-phosphatase/DNA-binding transcriptional ArsR family regulator
MEMLDAALAFATLGHPGRLAVFRLLMRFAPQGVRPTEMADALGVKPNTLSHYLADLTQAGLVTVTRRGRSLFYTVDLDRAEVLLGYLALDVGRARPDLLSALLAPDRGIASGATDLNVLFICTGNSARSIFAEAILRDLGKGRFQAYSAGTRPNTKPNPIALQILHRNGHDITGLRSKHVTEFQTKAAPQMDFVFTVCDTAAAEECPPWQSQPITGHWGLPDPVKANGTDAEKAQVFTRTYRAMHRRIAGFVALPLTSLNRLSVQSHVDAIGTDSQKQD